MERLFSEFNLDEDESDWSPVMLSESQLPEITTPAEDNEEAPKSPSRRKLSGDNMSMTDLTSNPAKLNM